MKKIKINLKQTEKVQAYNGALKKASKINHVIKHQNGWAVKKNGASKASAVFDNQGAAVVNATKMAKNDKSSVVIHAKNGRVQDVKRFN